MKINWVVFLCYDTDSHNRDISQFYEGDWSELRKSIENNSRTSIFDLAASADIEDIMLLDIDGVCSFLEILLCPIPFGEDLVSLLSERNNGLINDFEAEYSYAFLDISVGIYRDSTTQDIEEWIESEKEDGTYEEIIERLTEELEKSKHFCTIGIGIRDYYR